MSEDTGKGIPSGKLRLMPVNLIPENIKVLIAGGGEAGFIKLKSFSEKGADVTVISPEFSSYLTDYAQTKNIKFVKRCYQQGDAKNYHIIVIATDDDKANSIIQKECSELCKLCINCISPREGNVTAVISGETEETVFSVSVKDGSPMTSRLLIRGIKRYLDDYGDFIKFASSIRKKLKGDKNKKEILSFVNSDDFLFFFKRGKAEIILKLFYKDFTDI